MRDAIDQFHVSNDVLIKMCENMLLNDVTLIDVLADLRIDIRPGAADLTVPELAERRAARRLRVRRRLCTLDDVQGDDRR